MATPADSSIVQLAVADPQGARVAIYHYGEAIGFPRGKLSMINFLVAGKEGWAQAILEASSVALGMAWWAISEGRVPMEWEDETAPKSAQNESGKDNAQVAILQPTKTLGGGIYPAVITTIEPITSTFDGKPTEQLQFQYVVLNDDLQKTTDEIRGYTSAKWGARTKLYDWAKAILGKKCPSPDQPFDYDMLLNRKCDIQVEELPNKVGNVVAKITKLYPFKSMSVQVEEPDFDPEDREPVAAK